ncbi:hypothetical protein [Pseudomonas phage PAXYB1]|uniref:Uncharacterized protein n=8 Tax=Viruses TaxID=10239 RepID=A0A2P0PB46_9CAUD|nr:hypothetical protein HOS06_gp15 [Pseudomonas phage PT5]YP_009800405.1 hypothetical protein HOT06_gp21 [Pseudomonas phage PAXYB1]ABW23094.1 hypothetical phage protein [Pseudomonas phage PT5]ARB06198.1 hypothetical protein [Pseudomonas phage PAXYB1]QHZ59718.1 hypothetical protein vBPaePPE3_018 [Pseudomonas phage vB_PaeP_PE3]
MAYREQTAGHRSRLQSGGPGRAAHTEQRRPAYGARMTWHLQDMFEARGGLRPLWEEWYQWHCAVTPG